MDRKRIEELKHISSEVRKDILRMVGMARSGPYGAPLAAADLLVYLYWEELLLIPSEPRREDRDRFVLGTAEAVPALYAALARRGFFEREHLWHYRRLGSMLQAYPDFRRIPGMDAPCVTVQPSLAMAASFAEELARRCSRPRLVFAVSDAAMLSEEFAAEAARLSSAELPNLFLIIISKDENARAEEFFRGWDFRSADSCDFESLERACNSFDFSAGAPKALRVFARGETGISLFGEGQAETARSLSMSELDRALEELEVDSNEQRK